MILAGITIALITGQNSAPQKAVEARTENEAGAAKDAATMLVAEKVQGYYEDKYVKSPAATSASNQLAYIAEKLGSGVTTGDYTVTVTAAGAITVTKAGEELATGTVSEEGVINWGGSSSGGQQSGNAGGPTIVGGQLARGDIVRYDPGTLSTANVELPKGAELKHTKVASLELPTGATLNNNVTANQLTGWRVLDVTEEGDVLIYPTVGTFAELKLNGIEGFNNGISALNKISSIYENPVYSKKSRSFTIDDLNKIIDTPFLKADEAETIYLKNSYGIDDDFNIIYQGGITVEDPLATPGMEDKTCKQIEKRGWKNKSSGCDNALNSFAGFLNYKSITEYDRDKFFWLADRNCEVAYDRGYAHLEVLCAWMEGRIDAYYNFSPSVHLHDGGTLVTLSETQGNTSEDGVMEYEPSHLVLPVIYLNSNTVMTYEDYGWNLSTK